MEHWDPDQPYLESGDKITGGASGTGLIGGYAMLDIDIALGPFSDLYTLTRLDGSSFSFVSLDIVPIGSHYQFPASPDNDVLLQGYLNGFLKGTLWGTSQNGGMTLYATGGFGLLDTLVISGHMTDQVKELFAADDYIYDVHLGIDNIVLGAAATVPLPATGLLTAGAMGGLWLLRRRQKSRSA